MTANSSDAANAARLVGTWILVSNEWLAPDGRVVARPFGAQPVGQLVYTVDGSVSAILTAPDRPAGARPREGSPEDRVAAYDGLLAYSGAYEVRGDSVVHHVLAGSIPADSGADRVRRFVLDGDSLTLTAAPRLVDGEEQTHRITWRRRG